MAGSVDARINPLGGRWMRQTDLWLPLGAVAIVLVLIVPLPHWLLDVLLVANIGLALGVMLATFYTSQPLQLSSFPSLLLLLTLFRLSLNVAATRLILGQADAGAVIASFGSFVIAGNPVVGVVVFAILVVIQFVVITSGAGRVAEVAARFTLDAMPGKQMAIDADLNAGIIDEAGARARREAIAREADFYGAMDGASKFVRGDAIAAVVMIVVNILGGFVVGVLQRGMDLTGALQTYTVLTVGEGLVTQVPALLVSTASGLIVTRAGSSESSLGREVALQLTSQPRALAIAAGLVGSLALVPGLPRLPILLVGGLYGAGAYGLLRQRRPAAPKAPSPAPPPPENMLDLLPIDAVQVEIGYALVGLADSRQGGDLLERITAVRRQVATELGLVVPPIRVRDDPQLAGNTYVFKLRGQEVARGEVFIGQVLAMNPGGVPTKSGLAGIHTHEPAFGLPATWISENQRLAAEMAGYTVVDPTSVLVTHLAEIIRRHAPEILTRQDTQALLGAIRQQAGAVQEELIPNLLTLGQLQKVLQNLLAERVPIRDLASILEALADAAPVTKDPELLTEFARQRLARVISKMAAADGDTLYAVTVHPSVEQEIADSVRRTEFGSQVAMEPGRLRHFVETAARELEKLTARGYAPVLLCSPRVRGHVRQVLARYLSTVTVLSFAEVIPDISVQALGMVSIQNEDQAL
ncbi:MAG: flagellar biosynthesis protein FlhA [Armatimonadetes bacterium]|nr:flagellar biosynthesis protein FlhA [Armatimonadota bacterium]